MQTLFQRSKTVKSFYINKIRVKNLLKFDEIRQIFDEGRVESNEKT